VDRRGVPGGSRRVRYVGPAAACQASSEALRIFLGSRLPDYMVPSTIMLVPALPVTPNGKVDRAALPVPPIAPTSTDATAPRTLIEERLAEIVAHLLQVERVDLQ